jgi:hypothetical protein
MLSQSFIKKTLKRYAPQAASLYSSTKMRRHFRRKFLAKQIKYKKLIYGNADPIVLSGPFAGMYYLNETIWGRIECRWLGTYEQELFPIIHKILKMNYSTIIDVGSAEGYYAIGLARCFPNAIVYSYDTDPWARWQQRRLASMNGVRNVSIRGLCSSDELSRYSSTSTLLICDIEGFEYELLDPIKTPGLLRCDILVEVHDWQSGGLTVDSGKNELIRRFYSSHEITVVGLLPRDASSIDGLARGRLTPSELADCMDEERWAGQIWIWFESRARARQRSLLHFLVSVHSAGRAKNCAPGSTEHFRLAQYALKDNP